LEIEVLAAIMRNGPERVGLWTSTPGEVVDGKFVKVSDWREASRRWNSLISNASKKWIQWVCVMQRHKDGGVHYHVCFVSEKDIRGALDWEALRRRDYRSANEALREEWAFWREVAPKYGFGRVEVLPVRDANSLGRYLARYLARELGKRREGDRRARLVRYSQSWQRVVVGPFCWADVAALRARRRGEAFVKEFFGGCWGRVEHTLGRAWRWKLSRLLWASDAVYPRILDAVRADLKLYSGIEFVLNDVIQRMDRREAEARAMIERLTGQSGRDNAYSRGWRDLSEND